MHIPQRLAAVIQRIVEIEAAGCSPVSNASRQAFEKALVSHASITRLVNAAARKWSVDPALVQAIIEKESNFNPQATSPAGAQGLMQLEPRTANELGVGNAYDPAQNIWGGTRYVRGLLERFHGDLRLAIAAYNAGPGAVERYGGIPPYVETRTYVANVLAAYRKYKSSS